MIQTLLMSEINIFFYANILINFPRPLFSSIKMVSLPFEILYT